MELKDQIRVARQAMGLDQWQFAEQLHISRQTVVWWEDGVHRPKMARVKEIEGVLKVRLDLSERGSFKPLLDGQKSSPAVDPEMLKLALDISMLPKAQREAIITLVQANKNFVLSSPKDSQRNVDDRKENE